MGAETILKGNGRRATAGDKHYRGLSDPDQPRKRTLCRTHQALTGLVSTQQGSGSFFFGFSGMWWHRDHRGLGSRSLRARKHSELPVSVRSLCFILFFFNLTQLYDFFVYLYSTSKVSLKAKKESKSKLL